VSIVVPRLNVFTFMIAFKVRIDLALWALHSSVCHAYYSKLVSHL
jgi:hypothetical protein